MPTYNSQCSICGKAHEYTAKIADRENTPECCNTKTLKVIPTAPLMAMADDKPWLASKTKQLYENRK